MQATIVWASDAAQTVASTRPRPVAAKMIGTIAGQSTTV